MSTRTTRLWSYDTVKDLDAEGFTGGFEGWIGIKFPCKKPDMKKIGPVMEKTKKPAELWASYDGKKIVVDVRVGTAFKQVVGEFNFEAEKDNDKRWQLMRDVSAKNKKLITDEDTYKFQDDHPLKATVDDAEDQVAELKPAIEKLKAQVAGFKTFTYDHSPSADLSRGLRQWVEKKHWSYFLDFISDIDDGKDPKVIFETYIGDDQHNAKFPVNLGPAISDKIKQAIAANQKPDFSAARAMIVKVVDVKFIPEYRKESLPELQKELAHKEQYLGELNKLLAKH